MENFGYIIYTVLAGAAGIIILSCTFIAVTVKIARHKKFTPLILFFMMFGLILTYLLIPFYFFYSGFSQKETGLLKNNKNKIEKSERYLQMVLILSINQYEKRLTKEQLAELYAAGRNWNKAVKYYESAYKNYNLKNITYTDLPLVYIYAGEYDKAIEFEKNYGNYSFNTVLAYIMKKEYDKALKYLDKNSKNPFILNDIAIIYKKKGDYSKSEEFYEKALAACNNEKNRKTLEENYSDINYIENTLRRWENEAFPFRYKNYSEKISDI